MAKNKNSVDQKKYNLQGIILDTCKSLQELSQAEISDNDLEFFPDDYLSLYFEFSRLKESIDQFLLLYRKGNV